MYGLRADTVIVGFCLKQHANVRVERNGRKLNTTMPTLVCAVCVSGSRARRKKKELMEDHRGNAYMDKITIKNSAHVPVFFIPSSVY